MPFLLLYDLAKSKAYTRVKINRELNKIDAKMFQHSIWEHSNLNSLKRIADLVRENGGKAIILKKKIVY